jgi:hypothetical protein
MPHLKLLQSALELWGTRSRASQFMFRDHWKSRRNRFWQRLLSVWFFVSVLMRAGNKLLLHGKHISNCSGEVNVITGNLRAVVVDLMLRREVFLVTPWTKSPALIDQIINDFELRNDKPISLFLSINSLLVLSAWRGDEQVVLHVSSTPQGRLAIQKHYTGLHLAQILLSQNKIVVPKLLQKRTVHGCDVLMQTRLSGKTITFSELTETELDYILSEATKASLKISSALMAGPKTPCEVLSSEQYNRVVALYPQYADVFGPALEELREWGRLFDKPGVLVHGDYWLANVVCDKDSLCINGVIDWEYGQENGLPGYDALHFAIMTFAFGRSQPAADFIGQILTENVDDPQLTRNITQIQEGFGLTRSDVQHIALVMYFRLILKISVDTPARTKFALFDALLPKISHWTQKSKDRNRGHIPGTVRSKLG